MRIREGGPEQNSVTSLIWGAQILLYTLEQWRVQRDVLLNLAENRGNS